MKKKTFRELYSREINGTKIIFTEKGTFTMPTDKTITDTTKTIKGGAVTKTLDKVISTPTSKVNKTTKKAK